MTFTPMTAQQAQEWIDYLDGKSKFTGGLADPSADSIEDCAKCCLGHLAYMRGDLKDLYDSTGVGAYLYGHNSEITLEERKKFVGYKYGLTKEQCEAIAIENDDSAEDGSGDFNAPIAKIREYFIDGASA